MTESGHVPPELLLIPEFIPPVRCQRLIEVTRGLPVSESKTVVDTLDGGTADVVGQQRVTQQFDVASAEHHFVPLVRHIFASHVDTYFGVTTERFEYPMVLKYQSGGLYHEHNDAENQNPATGEWIRRVDRDYSILLYLNDDFTGGGLRFSYFDYVLQPKAGLLVAFPSGHPYEHEALPVVSGERFVVVSWAAMRGTPRVNPHPGAVIYMDPSFSPGTSGSNSRELA